jgi:hypothetical protein
MTKQEFEQFIDKHPGLTTHGIGVDNGKYTIEEEHENLKDCYEPFIACCETLEKQYELSKKKKDKLSSYTLKHVVERYSKDLYVPEGALVAAVIHLGLPYERIEKTTGIILQIRKK